MWTWLTRLKEPSNEAKLTTTIGCGMREKERVREQERVCRVKNLGILRT